MGGRVGYDVPVAQSATFRLKQYDTASDDDDASVVDEANAYAEGSVFRSQAGAGSAVGDPGGGIDDPGGGDTDDLGSLDNLATSTTTSSKTSVSFVSSSLTTGFSLMSLSDKSAVDATRLGGRRWYMDDCATGGFCLAPFSCLHSATLVRLSSFRRWRDSLWACAGGLSSCSKSLREKLARSPGTAAKSTSM